VLSWQPSLWRELVDSLGQNLGQDLHDLIFGDAGTHPTALAGSSPAQAGNPYSPANQSSYHSRANSEYGNCTLSFDFHFAERFSRESVPDLLPDILGDRDASRARLV
jgi:hypothetical protein